MIDLTIKSDKLIVLSSMKGKKLKSIEGVYDFDNKTFMEMIRFNLGRFSLEVSLDYVSVRWFFGEDHLFQDEATCFSIMERGISEKRIYPRGCEAIQLLKNEAISEVMIIRDRIKTNQGDDILVDSGFVIKTKENVYTFSRCDLSGFWFHMTETDKISMYYAVKDAKEECSNPEKNVKATVKRDYIFL